MRRATSRIVPAPTSWRAIGCTAPTRPRIRPQPPSRSTTALPTQLFQGMAFDPATTPFDFRTRHFSPMLEVWVQHEPCGYVDGLNAYLDYADNPLNFSPNEEV